MTFKQFTLTEGDKPVYIRLDYVTGVFENKTGDSSVTVINMLNGGYYTVKESISVVMRALLAMQAGSDN